MSCKFSYPITHFSIFLVSEERLRPMQNSFVPSVMNKHQLTFRFQHKHVYNLIELRNIINKVRVVFSKDHRRIIIHIFQIVGFCHHYRVGIILIFKISSNLMIFTVSFVISRPQTIQSIQILYLYLFPWQAWFELFSHVPAQFPALFPAQFPAQFLAQFPV